jgi:arabinose-5-phosphate isomerase
MNDILASAAQTLKIESDALAGLVDQLDESFSQAVLRIHESKGRVVITGIGKSANIAQKIVATFNSTGTPAIFMHAADAIHGDLGNVQQEDVVICISNSGNTEEIKALVPLIKQMGNTLVAIAGNRDSFLGRESDLCISSHVDKEACPNNLAPTSSTTAQLALGDAMAVCLLEMKDFGAEDFARFHPGGSLGKKLYTTVADLVNSEDPPAVTPEASIEAVILEISAKRLGACAVLENGRVLGIITDGDLRRMLERQQDFKTSSAKDIMSVEPKRIEPGVLASKALEQMEMNSITQLLVMEGERYLGMIHLHDILREGIES